MGEQYISSLLSQFQEGSDGIIVYGYRERKTSVIRKTFYDYNADISIYYTKENFAPVAQTGQSD